MATLLEKAIHLAYDKPSLRKKLLPLLKEAARGYYNYGGESLREVIRRWQEDGEKLRDPDKIRHKRHSMYAHGLFPVSKLWPYREYTWSKFDARRTPKEWDSLLQSMKEEGLREPLHFMIGREGGAKIGEGNHRLAIARELGMKALPVKFHFRSEVHKTTRPKTKPKPVPPKVKKEVEKLKKDQEMSPEERAELDRRVEEIMKYF